MQGRNRDWLDYVGTLLLPAVIAFGGIAYTAHKDDLDSRQQQSDRAADAARLALDRDSGYVKLLASSNDKERDLGLKIIDQLSEEHKFSVDLVPVVAAVAGGRPSDPATQTAARILNSNSTAVAQAALSPARNGAIEVYIQIAREEQRGDAQRLQATLRNAGYGTPGLELATSPTSNTYVRYFARDTQAEAGRIDTIMKQLGFASAVQDFTDPKAPVGQIEIWIGGKQGKIVSSSAEG